MSSRDPVRVQKFGGESLRDGDAVRAAIELVRARGGPCPAVVVSAHAGVTASLDEAATAALAGRVEWERVRIRHRTLLRQLDLDGELLDRHLAELRAVLGRLAGERHVDRRRRDFVLSFGERMSARVVAAALEAEGVPAAAVDAYDLGVVRGDLTRGPTRAAAREVLAGLTGVPVVTGFVALDETGHLTTLGPNGSDLTAVWLARELGAGEVQLWKTVPGVMTADPRLVPAARALATLELETAAELARLGAEVLHEKALEPARGTELVVRVLDVRAPDAPGTRIAAAERDSTFALAHRTRAHERPDGSALPPGLASLSIVGTDVGALAERALALITRVDPTSAGRRPTRRERSLTFDVAPGALAGAAQSLHGALLAPLSV